MFSKRFKNKTVTGITLLIFCLTTMVFGPVSPAVAGEWTQVTTTNVPNNYSRAGLAQHTNGYYIYLVGGIDNTGARYTTPVTRYDTRYKTYTKLGDLPVGLERTHVAYYNNALYIIGGSYYDGTTTGGKNLTTYRFDLLTNTCTTLGNAPRTPYYSGMAVQGTTAYFYGGQAVEGMLKYDLISDIWSEITPGPRGLDQFWFSTGFATSDGKVHFYGGRHNPTGTYYNNVVTYDPATGWSTTEIPAFGDAVYYAKAVVIGTKVIITGGTNGTQNLSRVISFDYNTKTWNTEPSLPYATASHMLTKYNDSALLFENGQLYGNYFASTVPGNSSWSVVETTNLPTNYTKYGIAQDNSYFYLVGGQDRFGGAYLKDVHRYDPANKTFTRLADMPVGLERGIVACVKDGYLYVFGGVTTTGFNNTVYRLSLTDNTWENLGTASPFYFQSGLIVQGNYGYFFGGNSTNEQMIRYDFASNTWTSLGSNSRALANLWQPSGFTTPDGKLHYYGGGTGTYTNDVVTYDPSDGSFSMSVIPGFGTPKRLARHAQIGSKHYFMGGITGTGDLDEVVSYDTGTGIWTQETPLPVAGAAGATVFGSTILAYVQGQLYQFNTSGPGNSILQAIVNGQSAAYFNPSVINPSQITLDGTDGVKATYTTSEWTVADARGTGTGWYATMSATIPTSTTGKTVSLSNLKLTVSNVSKSVYALTSSNPAMLQYPSGVALDTPRTMIASPANQGMGSFVFTPTLELSIPASSYAGQYNSTISASFYETAPSI